MGNTIFEASSQHVLLRRRLFNKCDEFYHVISGGMDMLEVGAQKMGTDYSTTIDGMHA